MSRATGAPDAGEVIRPTTGVPAGAISADERDRAGLRGRLVIAAAGLASRLPERPLVAAAESSGELWYRMSPAKRDQARANLRRVCEHLAERGRGPARARRAATDADALERLVRASFRHAARYYLEVLRAGSYDLETALRQVEVEMPDELPAALHGGRPVLIVGMHFGAIELPVTILADLAGHAVTAPMETVEDAALARWFTASRSRVGVNIIPIRNARRTLLTALRRGESVGLVADRDLSGSGLPVPFFGHPAPIAAGPGLLALETGVPIYAAAARRTGVGSYVGRLVRVPEPHDGTRRERLVAYTTAIAETFEVLIADAPEQWWGAFHPIWPDLVPAERAS
jgi:phosphatidylinositol dimannoside acyltransferase